MTPRGLLGKTERRLALVILLTTTVPLVVALWLATSMFRQASMLWFQPEVSQELDRGLALYKDYAAVTKAGMKQSAALAAADPELRRDVTENNTARIQHRLDELCGLTHELASLRLERDLHTVASCGRGRAVDEATERRLEVPKPLFPDTERSEQLVFEFATPRTLLDGIEQSGAIVSRYHQIEGARSILYDGYLNAFATLLGVMVIVTMVLGIVLARGITKRVRRLVSALGLVSGGDLSVRVPVTGSDELTELAASFNRMLVEMTQSRSRIEYLERMSTWQEMAQRLAHEIKNPLTPIQLAVEECHRQYEGPKGPFSNMLDSTLEIVEEEVATLRRLVSNFSNFARLPQAELHEEDLREFLRECETSLSHLDEPAARRVQVEWHVPDAHMPVALDRQMMRRVLVNIVENGVQAIEGAGRTGRVVVRVEPTTRGPLIVIEDDGPGVPADLRRRVFDPYVTTKKDGTGLGLAIVKKIVIEHGGEIEVGASTLGGARFAITLAGPELLTREPSLAEEVRQATRAGVHTDASTRDVNAPSVR